MLFNVSNRMLRAHGDPRRRTSRNRSHSRRQRAVLAVRALIIPVLMLPVVASAQTSPFLTGATALQSNILAWLTPIAVILIMALGAMAMANRLAWGWCLGAILGIAIAFGAPQIVTWVRSMFGV
jgi:type IV secretion system protein VirB2